jgi:hypothetical protein
VGMKLLVVLCLFAAVAVGCAGDPGPDPQARSTPTPAASPSVSEREPSIDTPKIDNRAGGAARGRVSLAIKDLKALGFWRRLTKNLYVVSVGSRPGRQYVPEDGHLAEARAFPYLDDDGGGRLCDITFFPTAIDDDLRLQTEYYDEGLLERAPPSVREFWVSILGHELAHCLPHQKDGQPALSPEPVAMDWEERVLKAAEARSRS